MPSATFTMSGRSFSIAVLSFAASAASPPLIDTPMCAGVHSTFASAFALQCALHSALICGGFTSPVHFGAFISTSQPPEHVPLHCAFALSWQLPWQFALQVPSQLPLHSAVPATPSHLP